MTTGRARTSGFFRRWPDLTLRKLFHEIWPLYEELVRTEGSVHCAFAAICSSIRDCSGPTPVRDLYSELRQAYGPDWLQGLASLLGMFMHFSTERGVLRNYRRPQKEFSSYPTSPHVTEWAGVSMLARLVKQPIPRTTPSAAAAERWAEEMLAFRLLDPAMESGQLLLETALVMLRRIHRQHPSTSADARRLRCAVLERLCHDCLWGIDRNKLALPAVSLVFSLLGAECGVKLPGPRNLLNCDALRWSAGENPPVFDGILSNPPWGETLRTAERRWIAAQFSAIEYQTDTYVAFSELAMRVLRLHGVFVLILPAQVLAVQNAAGLRELLCTRTELSEILVLPRPAFADACVRAVVLVGRTAAVQRAVRCRATVFPFFKPLDQAGPPRCIAISTATLRSLAGRPWWPELTNRARQPSRPTVRLGELATVHAGVQVYGVGRGRPNQTPAIVRQRPFTAQTPFRGSIPAIRGRDLRDFTVRDSTLFIRFGPWLARPGKHATLRRSTRVFVRELCRRDGKLVTAVANDAVVPLHGVLTLKPRGIEPCALVAILNSGPVAKHVRTHAASFAKVDFQKITTTELRELPIPASAIEPARRAKLGLPRASQREATLRRQLMRLAKQASQMAFHDRITPEMVATIDAIVARMYGSP
jgi:hypothetical protein